VTALARTSSGLTSFVHRSVVPAGAAEVFAWHERPEALRALLPASRFVRILQQTGGVRDGARVVFAIGIGRLRLVWEAVHYGYVEGAQFCDEQVRGPFRAWRHAHVVQPLGHDASVLEDRVEFALAGGRLVQYLSGLVVKRLLVPAFARRHSITRRGVLAVRGTADGHGKE
jgi:ligand-binding SRPBCC domain-containing protein